MKRTSNLKIGAMCSYILIAVNTFYGMFFTPFLINTLGDGEYGVYRIIASLVGSMAVLDFGIGATVLRYTAKYNAEKDIRGLDNFFAMGLIQAAALSVLMISVCSVVYFNLDRFYGESFSPVELIRAKQLFVLFGVILVLNTFEKVISGIISGCGYYAFGNGMKLMHIVVKCALAYPLLMRYADARTLLWLEIALLFVIVLVQLACLKSKCHVCPKLYRWDNALFGQSFKYTLLMFIQSLSVQMNGNLDNMVIGSVLGSVTVAVYSIGLLFYNMYEQFAVALSDMMLPTVSRQIAEGADNRQLEDTVIRVGRFEFILLGAALAGFLVIGKEFICMWLGEDYLLAWYVAVILMIPTTIPLVQNVSISILRAKNKMGFRTAAVCIMAGVNFLLTLVGVKHFGVMAACVSTALALVIANIIAMNIYYVKVIKLNVFRIFKNVFARSWLCCALAAGVLAVVDRFLNGGWWQWCTKVVIFCVIYGGLLLAYGFSKEEKNFLFQRICSKKKRGTAV